MQKTTLPGTNDNDQQNNTLKPNDKIEYYLVPLCRRLDSMRSESKAVDTQYQYQSHNVIIQCHSLAQTSQKKIKLPPDTTIPACIPSSELLPLRY